MIKKVEIYITNQLNFKMEAIIWYEHKICYLNQKRYEVDKNFLRKLFNLLHTFSEQPSSTKTMDAEECTIRITSSNDSTKYHWKGNFPLNYIRLKKLLGDLYESKIS